MLDLIAGNARAVEARLRALGWIPQGERITALGTAGEGNMNRTLRAQLGNRSLILKQSVPFVAKYPHIPAPAERIAVEAAFYTATASDAAIASRLPKVIGFDADNRLLALEDLGMAADFTHVYQRGGDTLIPHIPTLLSWLSALHAMPVRSAEKFANGAMRELNHAHIFQIPFAADNGLDLDATTPGLAKVAADVTADAALTTGIERLGEIYLGVKQAPSSNALLHGDFYPGSWLRVGDDVRIIDPEFTFVGAPEFDVGVFAAHLMFAGVDRANALAHYSTPRGFSMPLARAFAGVEVMRRLLGVAQLPLTANLEQKRQLIDTARSQVMNLS